MHSYPRYRLFIPILGSEEWICDYMDYEKFKKEVESFDQWMEESRKDYVEDLRPAPFHLNSPFVSKADVIRIKPDDRVNHPSHYTRGSQEAIVTIEEAIEDAPSVKAGMLQGQVLKYLLRLWLKDNPAEDAKKARWYLDRLIDSL